MIYAVEPKKKTSKDDIEKVKEELQKYQKDKNHIPVLPFGWRLCEAGVDWDRDEEE